MVTLPMEAQLAEPPEPEPQDMGYLPLIRMFSMRAKRASIWLI